MAQDYRFMEQRLYFIQNYLITWYITTTLTGLCLFMQYLSYVTFFGALTLFKFYICVTVDARRRVNE